MNKCIHGVGEKFLCVDCAEEEADVVMDVSATTRRRRMATEKSYRDVAVALQREIADLRAENEKLRAALAWCSGSADFGAGGIAEKGWDKMCRPLLGEAKDG